jgi:hypothetical protein
MKSCGNPVRVFSRIQRPLATFFKSLLTALCGLALGLLLTLRTLDAGLGFGALKIGPWTAWPKNGTVDIDPYSHARLARSGEMPLGTAEGLSFIARTDSAGELFRPNCDYQLQGPAPTARYWTLTLLSPAGLLIDNKAQRYGFTSSEILRDANDDFTIVIAPQARPGNWLPTGGAGKYLLLFQLYDTALGAAAATIDAGTMPRLVKGQCR